MSVANVTWGYEITAKPSAVSTTPQFQLRRLFTVHEAVLGVTKIALDGCIPLAAIDYALSFQPRN